jgi:hypothetical protein
MDDEVGEEGNKARVERDGRAGRVTRETASWVTAFAWDLQRASFSFVRPKTLAGLRGSLEHKLGQLAPLQSVLSSVNCSLGAWPAPSTTASLLCA